MRARFEHGMFDMGLLCPVVVLVDTTVIPPSGKIGAKYDSAYELTLGMGQEIRLGFTEKELVALYQTIGTALDRAGALGLQEKVTE